MLKRTFVGSGQWVTLAQQNRYYLLDHHYLQKIKKGMFDKNQKTLWLKSKFILKQAKYTLVQGSKDLWNDTIWMIRRFRQKRYNQFTAYQKWVTWRITTDLFKFIPYSILILIPFAQVLIPVLVWVFPNAVPSFFRFDTAEDERITKLQQHQQKSHAILIQKLMDVLRQDFKKEQQFTQYDFFKRDFFEIIDEINVKLNYRDFSSDELIHVLRFLGGDFVTGTATINKIVNLITMTIPRFIYKIVRYLYRKATTKKLQPYKDPFFVVGDFRLLQFNYFPFQYFKRKLLLWQIALHFRNLKKQDVSFQRFGMDDIEGFNVKHFARNRGFAAISCYFTLKNVLKKDWVKITTHPKFTDNTKLWYSVMMFHFMNQANKDHD